MPKTSGVLELPVGVVHGDAARNESVGKRANSAVLGVVLAKRVQGEALAPA